MQAKRRVGYARSAACHHHARLAGELGVGNCGKTGAALVAASHEIDLIAFVQGVKKRKKAFAGYAKCPVNAVRDQRIYDEIGNPKSHAQSPLTPQASPRARNPNTASAHAHRRARA